MRRLAPLILLVLVAGLFFAGRAVRTELGIELSPESIQGAVASLGWRAPAIYLCLVTFRQFLLLPSALLLPVGGVIFGAGIGTLLGALGILFSAVYKYSICRALGREWLRPRFGAAVEAFEKRAEAAGPWIVALVTAHPIGPMTPIYHAASLAAVPVAGFLLAVALAAPVRAFAFSLFGSTLLELGTPRFWLASALLAAVALIPIVHRGTRERLLRDSPPVDGRP